MRPINAPRSASWSSCSSEAGEWASGVEPRHVQTHMTPVSVSKLFAMLIAVAMLFAPFAMQSGSAMAAMPSDHHAQVEGTTHCDGQSRPDQDSKSAEKPCCVAMCVAVTVAPTASADPHRFSRTPERPALDQFERSFLAELPTPPPRLA